VDDVLIRQGSRHDLIGVHNVKIAHARAVGEPFATLAEQRESWERNGFDPTRDVWVAVDDETIVGYGELTADRGARVGVLPEQAGRGVHERVLHALEEAARARGMPWVTAIATDVDKAALAVYEAEGWNASREVRRMWVDHESEPPPAVFPEGITVRTYDDEDAERVHGLLDDAYLGWDDEYVAVPHDDWLAFMTTGSDYDPRCWFLAEAGGELAGVCLNWSTGWVKDLAVRPEWRRRGLGEALLRHTFRELFQRGVRRIGLKVDSRNGTGAPRLYERLGFVTDRRYTMFLKRL
jgi:ribosomal protein S18 acetylase RimI-like enzyme